MRNIILHLNLLVDAARAQQAHEHEKGVFIHLLADLFVQLLHELRKIEQNTERSSAQSILRALPERFCISALSPLLLVFQHRSGDFHS
jgi:hypothetical protein